MYTPTIKIYFLGVFILKNKINIIIQLLLLKIPI